MKRFVLKLKGLVPFAVLIPLIAGAVFPPPPTPFTSVGSLLNDLRNILSAVFAIFLVVATIMIIWAAYSYSTAGGDEEKIRRAKAQFVAALIGIVIALIAQGIRFVIANIFGINLGSFI